MMARKDRTEGSSGNPRSKDDETQAATEEQKRDAARKGQAQEKEREHPDERREGENPDKRREDENPDKRREGENPDGTDQPMPTPRGARQPEETDPNADPDNPDPQTPRTAQTFAQADHPDQGPLRLDASGRANPELQQPGKYDPRALSGEESKHTEVAGEPLSRPSGQAAPAIQRLREENGETADDERDGEDGEKTDEQKRRSRENDDSYEGSRKFQP